jgi:hypothetical protein
LHAEDGIPPKVAMRTRMVESGRRMGSRDSFCGGRHALELMTLEAAAEGECRDGARSTVLA